MIVWRTTPTGSRPYFVPYDSVQYEALSFPLLFFEGEDGWPGAQLNKYTAVKAMRYVRHRVLMPEVTPISVPGAIDGTVVELNRFQALDRLSQAYIVDMHSRIQDNWFRFLRKHSASFLPHSAEQLREQRGVMSNSGV